MMSSGHDSQDQFEDELVGFTDDAHPDLPTDVKADQDPWRILIVDDDEDVHQATEYALRGVAILDRSLCFLHAYSAEEAVAMLRQEKDIAVILLDVVMETENAGLAVIARIRQELGLFNPRIILRTGQPGYAPEIETIRLYDINDYKTKSELTRSKMFTTLTAAIRSYDQLCRLDASRIGLEQIIRASNQFISDAGVQEFSIGVISQIAAFIGAAPEGIVCARSDSQDASCIVIAATGHYSQFTGHPLDEVANPGVVEGLLRCLGERRSIVESKHVSLFFPGRNAQDFAVFIESGQGMRDIDQRLLEVFCANIAICGDNVRLVDALRTLAYNDLLLKLPNRACFIEAINLRLAAKRTADPSAVPENLVVALLDVDQFAEINDMLGHQYGDYLLNAIARRLEANFAERCTIARISNDIFGLFGDETIVSPETLEEFFNATFEIEGVKRPVSMSAGFVSTLVSDSVDGDMLLKDASIAVKRAKENGQGQFAWYSPEIAVSTRERTQLLEDLRHAFNQGMFFLAYQPQVDLTSGKVTGVEALLRWRTREGRMISPEVFIPVAEQSGLIIGMGSWVLNTALRDSLKIAQAGHPGIRMAVNVSTNQFRQPEFIQEVFRALDETGVAPELLELEVTESVAAMGLTHVEEALRELRARGISVAIDDFGTGYSSLSYLGRLSANRLKIDHSFIWNMSSDSTRVNIPQMVIPLGHQLDMQVIAEGVETEEQLRMLQELGCDEIQGYYYGRPMPLDELILWLGQRNPPS